MEGKILYVGFDEDSRDVYGDLIRLKTNSKVDFVRTVDYLKQARRGRYSLIVIDYSLSSNGLDTLKGIRLCGKKDYKPTKICVIGDFHTEEIPKKVMEYLYEAKADFVSKNNFPERIENYLQELGL